jgi:hypothetical protein
MKTGMVEEPNFTVRAVDDYVRLDTWGRLRVEDVEAPAEAALALAREKGLDKLLDNIQNVDFSTASVYVQAKGMGVLWKLKSFRKVAIVFEGSEPGYLFFSSIQVLHLDLGKKFQGFDNEKDAIKWLRQQ